MLSGLEDKFGHLEAASKDLASQVCQSLGVVNVIESPDIPY